MAVSFISESVRAVIGAQSDWQQASLPVEPSEVRRFFQATMDHSPRYWDADAPQTQRQGGLVAPLGFPVHAYRRAASDVRDPLQDSAGDPDFDGVSRAFRPGLPPVPVALGGILNGGYEYEFFSYPRLGERILLRSRYRDVLEKQGRSKPMVLVLIEDEYASDDQRPLLRSLNTMIMR